MKLELSLPEGTCCFFAGTYIALARKLTAEFDRKLEESSEITIETLAAQTPGERLRNGIARLIIPLL